MSLILLLPAIVALIGILVYFVAANPKLQEVGRIMFLAGMIGVCLGHWGDWSMRPAIHDRR